MKLKIFLASLTLVGIGGFGVYLAPLPKYKTQNIELNPKFTEMQIAEGKRIALMICVHCHMNEETGTLAGRHHGNPKRLGEFNSGNITQDSSTGIGLWSNGELYYFLKTGIKPDGDYVFDMPKYPNLSEEDMMSLIGFLRGDDALVHETKNATPKPQFSLLTKILLHTIIEPPDYKEDKVPSPDTNDLIAFGRYLATAKFSCYECHSLNSITNDYNYPEKSWGFLKGGNPHVNEERKKIYTANISGDTIKGIGAWSEVDFRRALKNGIKRNGTAVKDPMFPFYLLSDREVKAIFLYLKSIP